MSVEVVMPKLSDTMEEGTILKWLKQVGDTVARGDVLAEVETDKADMELEAAMDGVLEEIKVQEGENAAVGAVIALVEEQGAGAGAPQAGAAATGGTGAGDGASADAPRTPPPTVLSTGAPGAAPSRPARAAGPAAAPARAAPARTKAGLDAARASAARPPADEAAKATPAARKLAGERGVDLRALRGSGPGGRIVTDDVAAAASAEPAGDAATAVDEGAPIAADTEPHVPPVGPSGGTPVVRRELSRMRQSIARRMSEAFREIPHFYVTAEIDMTEAARMKEALKRSELFATPISYTHMVLKATALALKRHPRLNASYRDEAIEMKGEVNLGMAVAVEDGLIVPVLRHVDELSLADIAAGARRLVDNARRGRFEGDDLSGGTFTVSNMGMLDVEEFAAVINPPQAAILAVGSVKERAVVRDGTVVARRTMRVTVSCDHRIIDGVVAGRFLEELKALLENPIVLVVRE